MRNPEFEYHEPLVEEIDWSPETPGMSDFSVQERQALRWRDQETIHLNGLYLTSLLKPEVIDKLRVEFGGFGFDFTNLRTMRSEVAVSRSFFLRDTKKQTFGEENEQYGRVEKGLVMTDELRKVRVRRGNLADAVAICLWYVQHGMNMQGLPYYLRTSTTDVMYQGNISIGLLFKGVIRDGDDKVPLPDFKFRDIKLDASSIFYRAAPIIVPEKKPEPLIRS